MKIKTLLLSAAAAIATGADVATGNASAIAPAPGAAPATPGNDKPTTPEQLRDVKLSQLLAQKPSFETLKKIGLAALTGFAKECVETQTKVKNAAEKFKKSAKGVGKVLAAMKITYAEAQDGDSPALAKGTSFEEYHKQQTGEKPWNHAMQCARVFLELVIPGKLDEKDYDRRAADWLQTASTIIGELKDRLGANYSLEIPEIAELCDIIANADDDEGAKALRKFKARVKGTDESSDGDTVPAHVLTLKEYDALLRRGCTLTWDGVSGILHTISVIGEMGQKVTDEALQRNLFRALYTLPGIGNTDQQTKWLAELDAEAEAKANPVKVITAEPVAQAA